MVNTAVFVLFEIRELFLSDVHHVGGLDMRRAVRVMRIVGVYRVLRPGADVLLMDSLFVWCRENT
jgi:hypothetical protein